MAVTLRLMRLGKTHRPFYRVCVFDERRARGGKYIESIGHYDPTISDDSKKFTIDEERAAYWLGVGAKTSETVRSFLRSRDVPGLERRPRPKRRKAEGATEGKKKRVPKAVIEQAKKRAEKTRKRKERKAKARERAEAQAKAAAESS